MSKDTTKINLERFFAPVMVLFILVVGFFCNIYLRLYSAIHALNSSSSDYFTSTIQGAWMFGCFFLVIVLLMFLLNFTNRSHLLKPLYFASAISCVGAIFGRFICDITWMFAILSKPGSSGSFNVMLKQYFADEWWVYGLILLVLATLIFILRKFKSENIARDNFKQIQNALLVIPLILTFLLTPYILNTLIFIESQNNLFLPLDCGVVFSVAYVMLLFGLWISAIYLRTQYKLYDKFFIKLAATTGISAAIAFCIIFFSLIYANKTIMLRSSITSWNGIKLFSSSMLNNLLVFIPLILVLAFSAIARQYFRKRQFEAKGVDETTGSFGTSSWATEEYLSKIGAYSDKGSLFGKDDKGRLLRCPTKNRTIIAAPGGGKSAGIVVPALLTEDRPVFVNDIRGELWVVTAKQRAQGFGRKRKVIAIDPFRILQQSDYRGGKPDELLQIYTMNPFDYISRDKTQRDRDINALVSSLVVREGETNSHWDDNAEILLSGLVDFILRDEQNIQAEDGCSLNLMLTTATDKAISPKLPNNMDAEKLLKEHKFVILKSAHNLYFYAYAIDNHAQWFTVPYDKLPEELVFPDKFGEINTIEAEHVTQELWDFIASKGGYPNDKRASLIDLYDFMAQDLDSMNLLLESMLTKGGYAQAAAAQVLKTAPEERGSIYSTTFRQLKWLVDSNMRQTFQDNNFDLRDFVKGDMDIFVIIPEDQIVFHQRVFRMLFTLVTNILSQTLPSNLPKRDILFILDELGQYGYCRDVERAIEILRARGAVVWALFQSYGQIKLYKKPDLFTNAKVKQIFEIDDEETMRWIQALGGKKTVLTKTLTTHSGDSRQKMQAFGGTVSKGEGENVHETGTDLIHINEIRELAEDEQFVFIRGEKAIKCKRLLYFNDKHFVGTYDANPLARIDQAD